jgi:acetyltransferase-like isoleucine patch superfamily enzyme
MSKINPLTSDPGELERMWYVPPKPPVPTGWCVFSKDFVLENLQGCFGYPERVKRTRGWLIFASLALLGVAFGQAIIMFLSKIPVLSYFVWFVARGVGRNPLGFLLRSSYCKTKFKSLGQDTLIDPGITIWGTDRIEIGSRCIIGMNVQLSCGRGDSEIPPKMHIGDYCFIGPGSIVGGSGSITLADFVSISAGAHLYSTTAVPVNPAVPGQLLSMSHGAPPDHRHSVTGPIVLEDYAFVGIHSVVLPNVTIGKGALVHSFTEIRESVPPYANVVGPGKGVQRGWRRPFRIDPRKAVPPDASK